MDISFSSNFILSMNIETNINFYISNPLTENSVHENNESGNYIIIEYPNNYNLFNFINVKGRVNINSFLT